MPGKQATRGNITIPGWLDPKHFERVNVSLQRVMEGEAVCVDETELAQDGIQMIDSAGRSVLLVSHGMHHLRQTLGADF